MTVNTPIDANKQLPKQDIMINTTSINHDCNEDTPSLPPPLHVVKCEDHANHENLEKEQGNRGDDASSSAGTTFYSNSHDTVNNEIQKVRDKSKKDSQHVKASRLALGLTLLAVGVAVTWTTYKLLRDDEIHTFETAFDRFSKTLEDAAVRQQEDIRNAFNTFGTILTGYAQSTNATWPFVTLPFFESYAHNFFVQSKAEAFSVFPLIKNELREEWVDYVNDNYQAVFDESHKLRFGNTERLNQVGYKDFISAPDPINGGFVPDKPDRGMYFPSWHFSPPPFTYGFVNWNIASVPDYGTVIDAALTLKHETVVSKVRKHVGVGTAISYEEHEAMHSKLRDSSTEHPHSFFFRPVFEKVDDENSPIVAIITSPIAWDVSLLNLLPEGVEGLHTVIQNDCGQVYTYEIIGPDAIFLGEGDLHEPHYDKYKRVVNLALHSNPDFPTTEGHCQFSMHIYPGSTFEASFHANVPIIYAVVLASTFLLVAIVFFIYNGFVSHRNEKLVKNAARSNAVIAALFPKNIRDRIMEDDEQQARRSRGSLRGKRGGRGGGSRGFSLALTTKTMSSDGTSDDGDDSLQNMNRPPLADYFPETTILFADISGFTAWSSVREPPQVFTLLETLYGAFDKIAKHSRIFKVETVGDCYVAATGIPEFHKEHAVDMVRFARKILAEMAIITSRLEISLGPDTDELSLRVGIHSGPVTAGVLRGERARFQLFGDTMNTASRIESTGEAGRIHLSRETAECLMSCGRGNWLVKRNEPVKIKGKGDIQTYWIGVQYDFSEGNNGKDENPGLGRHPNQQQPSHGNHKENCQNILDPSPSTGESSVLMQRPLVESDGGDAASRERRLVDWNVQMLMEFLKQIVARRITSKGRTPVTTARSNHSATNSQVPGDEKPRRNSTPLIMEEGFIPLDEVQEVIRLPDFDGKIAKLQKNHHQVKIPMVVERQLHLYVTCVAKMYRTNDFHNFEHASHVTMSVIKLLSRIVAPTELDEDLGYPPEASLRAQLHDHTYGITSDPLTQFACAFSALIHDVDHLGVPNAQLVKEKTETATRYKNRSVAEQNSMVLAWNLLMEDRFIDLRLCVCETPQELRRFKNLVINAVMATDITDKELKNLRNARWDKAFKSYASSSASCDDNSRCGNHNQEQDVRDAIHRKATIVIEHLLQASDVAHTMQHWHVYRKWNERFFRECYAAYKAGRAETDPSENWYNGELGFFDYYIIPLAKKLDTCGVFGKSSDEYLSYALQNREEWKNRGEAVVAEMIEAVRKENHTGSDSSTSKHDQSGNDA